MGAYHFPSQSDSYFFEHLDKALDIYSNPCMDSFL